jgi:phage virion morphogenesis protein
MAAGVDMTVTLDGRALAEIDRVFARLGSDGVAQIAREVGALVERQTKDRITEEKAGPDGAAWAPWSARYARTRSARHSLLVGSENLLESIQDYTSGDTVRVGTRTPYSAIQQFGGRGIPARPYLGLSADNRREIEDLVVGRVEELLS